MCFKKTCQHCSFLTNYKFDSVNWFCHIGVLWYKFLLVSSSLDNYLDESEEIICEAYWTLPQELRCPIPSNLNHHNYCMNLRGQLKTEFAYRYGKLSFKLRSLVSSAFQLWLEMVDNLFDESEMPVGISALIWNIGTQTERSCLVSFPVWIWRAW